MKIKKIIFSGIAAGVLASSVAQAEWSLKGYGFLIPNTVLTSSGVESFSQPNSSAYTAALNPVFSKTSRDSTFSWQVAQSRAGIKLNESNSGAEGMLEFDFIDFTKASPTTAANPRVRRAFVKWQSANGWSYQLGQDWDLISNTVPFTYNFVGHYFETGDIGFMRMQFMGLKKFGDWESGWALGMPTQNSTSGSSGVELGAWPTISFRQTYLGQQDSKFGASVLMASVRPSTADSFRIFAGSFSLFGEGKIGETKWISKAYVGQNTSNLGMLGLAYGDRQHSQTREAGMYFSFQHPLSDQTRIFGGVGGSFILNPQQMASSYKFDADLKKNVLNSTGPGIERNLTARIGLDHDIIQGLVGFTELAYLNTRHHLLAADSSMNPIRSSWVLNTGVKLSF